MQCRRFFAGLVGAVSLLGLSGCVSFERLVDTPERSDLATLAEYDTSLHQRSIHLFNPVALERRAAELRLQSRVDKVYFLIDQGVALGENYRGVDASLYARELVRRFVRTMPKRGFAGTILIRDVDNPQRWRKVQLQELTADSVEQIFGADVDGTQHEYTSLAEMIDAVTGHLKDDEGPVAVVLVTAWSAVNDAVEQAVLRMRQQTLFRGGIHVLRDVARPSRWDGGELGVCFYTLGVGNRFSRTRLERADTCGESMAGDKVAQPRDMAHFVQRVLYKGPADTDGDGIYDYIDRCPNTPAGRMVDFSGCLRFPGAGEGNVK